MITHVIKRSGKEVEFNDKKIKTAIKAAFDDVHIRQSNGLTMEQIDAISANNDKLAGHICRKVCDRMLDVQKLDVEDIQDMVEKELMNERLFEEATAYIRYRKERGIMRHQKNSLDVKIEGLINLTDIDAIKDNANRDGKKLQTSRIMITDMVCKDYAIRNVLSNRVRDNHEKYFVYQHDMNYMMFPFFNCALVNWIDMLDNGFKLDNTIIETPKSIETAMALLAQIIAHVASNCYGGLTLDELPEGLSTYVDRTFRKHYLKGLYWVEGCQKTVDDRVDFIMNRSDISYNKPENSKAWKYAKECTEESVKNAIQGFQYEIETLMNSRVEVPFLTICLTPDTTEIGRLIQRVVLEQRLEGLTGGVTPVFPKIIYVTKKNVNLEPGDPNYDIFELACKCSVERMYPDYVNYERIVEVTGGYKGPMGCRSFLGEYIDENGNRKTHGRFNQGVSSIILPNLALEAGRDEAKFYELLDEALDVCYEALMFRHNILRTVTADQAPILYMSGAIARLKAGESIIPLLENGYSSLSIGYLGVSNAVRALYGEDYDKSPEVMAKAEYMVQYLRDYCEKKKEETGLGFSLYSTPAESLCDRACRASVERFGIVEGVNDRGYFDNSFHVPVTTEISPFKKIELESHFSKVASGGAIQYVQFGSLIKNHEALMDIVKYAREHCHYFGTNSTPDQCFACGFKGELKPVKIDSTEYICPQCGNTDRRLMSVIRRTCGYLTSAADRGCVDGKMKEIHSRYAHVK